MKTRISLCLLTLAMSVASAASSYRLTLFQPSIVNGQELKAGEYRLEVDGDKARITAGKTSVEATVKTETADTKFSTNSVRYKNGDGKYRVQEIRLGGTKTRLVFEN